VQEQDEKKKTTPLIKYSAGRTYARKIAGTLSLSAAFSVAAIVKGGDLADE
jgi:hypothetical protein